MKKLENKIKKKKDIKDLNSKITKTKASKKDK